MSQNNFLSKTGLNRFLNNLKTYINSEVVSGVNISLLYNGLPNNAVLSGNIQQLSDSIFNYHLILVYANCDIGNGARRMLKVVPLYPCSDILAWCDTTGAGADGAFHEINCNTGFGNGNGYRVMFGFTDATHIRNIVSNPLGSWSNAGICCVVGFKFGILPNTYATKQYVDDAIASSITDAIRGSY